MTFDLLSNLSQIAAREVWAFSSSTAKVVLVSLDWWRDWSVACLEAFSSSREFSIPNRTDFSSDSAFYDAFKLLDNTVNREDRKSAKEIKRNSEGVNGLSCWSTSLFFKPSKNSIFHRQKSQASAADSVEEPVTPTKWATEVAYEEGASWAIFFDGSTCKGFLQTKIIKYIKFTSYQGNCGFDQSTCQIDFASPQDNSEVLSLKMHTIGSTPVQIITHH
jgi:hypothetical protein